MELFRPSDKFWSGVEETLFVWNQLEEAAIATGIVTNDKTTHKLSTEVSL